MLCLPDGLVRLSKMSGTPDTLAVNAIVPLANAANGFPDGASVTDSVSTTSAYNSFEVCRTLARLQGRAGVLEGIRDGALEVEKLAFSGGFLCCYCLIKRSLSKLLGKHLPRQIDAPEQLAHPAFYLDNLSKSVWLRRADIPRIAHLGKQLGNDIVVGLDLDCQQRRPDEVFKDIDNAVQKFEHQQWFNLL